MDRESLRCSRRQGHGVCLAGKGLCRKKRRHPILKSGSKFRFSALRSSLRGPAEAHGLAAIELTSSQSPHVAAAATSNKNTKLTFLGSCGYDAERKHTWRA